MKRLIVQIALLLMSFLHLEARAQFGFYPALFYDLLDEDNTNMGLGSSELTKTYYDLRLGYTLTNKVYVGGIYAKETRDSGSNEVERTSSGASLGYMGSHWFLMGHYFFQSEQRLSATSTLKEGSGFQVDLGYLFNISSSFKMGPQISHKSFSYKKLNNTNGSADHTLTTPYLIFGIQF